MRSNALNYTSVFWPKSAPLPHNLTPLYHLFILQAIRAVSASSSDAEKTLIDRKSVNYLLMAYANCGDVDGAFHVLSRFKNKGFSPDTVTINTLLQSIDTASTATHDEKLDAFSSYLWGKDLVADHITLKRAMSIFGRYGGDESKGVKWLDGLLDNGISADNILLEKLRPLLGDIRIEIHRGRNTSDQRAASVNAGSNSILKSSPLPLPVPLPSPSHLPSPAPSISHTERTTAEPLKAQTPTSTNPSPHKPSFVFVVGLVSGEQPDAVIKGALHTENQSNFIALLDKYSSIGDAKSVKGILDMMKTCNMPLGMLHYNHLLRSHAVKNNVVEARRVVKGCNKVGLQLDMDSRHHLCDLYVNSSDAVRAEQVLLDVQQSGSQPGTVKLRSRLYLNATLMPPVTLYSSLYTDLNLLKRIMQLHADAGNAAGVEKVRLLSHKDFFFLSNHYSS